MCLLKDIHMENIGAKYTWNIYSKLKYQLKSESGKEINIGDSVNIYIKQEIKNLQNINGLINIDGKEYKYCGKITDNIIKSIEERGNYIFFNETNDKFLDEVNDITLFEGIIDFDI